MTILSLFAGFRFPLPPRPAPPHRHPRAPGLPRGWKDWRGGTVRTGAKGPLSVESFHGRPSVFAAGADSAPADVIRQSLHVHDRQTTLALRTLHRVPLRGLCRGLPPPRPQANAPGRSELFAPRYSKVRAESRSRDGSGNPALTRSWSSPRRTPSASAADLVSTSCPSNPTRTHDSWFSLVIRRKKRRGTSCEVPRLSCFPVP